MGHHWSAEDQNSPTEAQAFERAEACPVSAPRENLFEEIHEFGVNPTLG